MANLRVSLLVTCLLFPGQHALAQSSTPVSWDLLADPAAQQFDDPYRDLSESQFESLIALARLRIALDGELPEGERDELRASVSALSLGLQAQGLDPEWILAQREAVAERRQHAALATNAALEGEHIELIGYLLVGRNLEDKARVAYLLPDRSVCMHLPPPAPNQVIRLEIAALPEPLSPCIATVVRGRLSAIETTAKVPVFDDTVRFWSRWQLEVSEAITSGAFAADDDPSGKSGS